MSDQWLQEVKSKRAIILVIVFVSLILHAWAIWRLPEDNDEPVYLGAAADYSKAVRAADIRSVIDYPGTRESPPLVKLIYSIPFIFRESITRESRLASIFARSVSALFGTLTIAMAAAVDPLAGILLLFHSIFTKYTSLAMLDALSACASLAAVLALLRYQPKDQKWLWISASALSLAVAGKYNFAFIALPILAIFLQRREIPFKMVIIYGLVGLLVFWMANPTLWHDPIQRMLGAISFHTRYSQGQDVARANFPWYQPVIWLFTTVRLHPSVALYPALDPLITTAALIGLYSERKSRPWLAIWVIGGVLLLLAWPTKWPHYTLLITAPLCLAGAAALRKLFAGVKDRWEHFRNKGRSD